MKEQQLTHQKMYECFFMELFEDEVLLPNSKKSKRIYIEHPGAAAVLPITKEGKVLLIKQFRYPIREITIEVPAGKKDEIHETGYDCVKRELEEETGYQSNDIVKFIDMHSCLGYSNELVELFIAKDAYKVENPLVGDDDEFIEVLELNRSDIIQLFTQGKITDAKTIILLQEYLRIF